MATIDSKKYTEAAGQTRYFRFNYSTSKYSQGVTKVTWWFKSYNTGGGSGLSIYASCKLSASITTGSLYSGSLPSYSQGNIYTSFDNGSTYTGGASHAVNKSGTFYVKHNTSGNMSVKINIAATIYDSTNRGNSGTISVSGNPPYTNCTKPTSVSVSPTIVKPGGTVTVSWSGAAAGTANPISAYNVIASVNAYPSSGATRVHSTSVYTTSGSGSTTFTALSSGYRGSKVQFEVQTVGKYNTTTLAESPGAIYTVNSLPAAPTVTISRSTVPSSGGSVTFKVTPGSDGNGQSTSVWYYTNRDSTEKQASSSFSHTIDEDITYYFRTWDGLEYSSYTTKTISLNSAPWISISATGNSYNYNGTNYDLTYNLEADSKADATFRWYIYINGTWKRMEGSGATLTNVKPWEYGVKPGDNFYFSVIANDGIEDTKEVSTKEKYGDYTYPLTYNNLTRIFNQFNSTNIVKSNGDIYNKVRVYLPVDNWHRSTSSVQVSGTYKIGTETKNVTSINYVTSATNASYESSSYYCDITIPTDISSGASCTFTITINADNFIRTYSFTKQRTYSFQGGIMEGLSIIKPFTNTDIYSINISPVPVNFILNEEYQLNNFNISDLSDITLELNYNGKITSLPCQVKDYDINTNTNSFRIGLIDTNERLSFTIGKDVWYNGISNLDMLDLLNSQYITASIKIKNLFGYVAIYSQNLRIDFQENMSLSFLNTYIGKDSNYTILDSNSTSIREGQNFKWEFKVMTYNKQQFNAQVYICRKDNNVLPNINDSEWQLYSTQQFEVTDSDARNTARLFDLTKSMNFTIPQLAISKYIFFKIVVTDIYNKIVESNIISVGASNRHIAPSIQITNWNYEITDTNTNSGIITIHYNILDNGAGNINTNNLVTNLANSLSVRKTINDESGIINSITPTIFDPINKNGIITVNISNFSHSLIHLEVEFKTRLNLDNTESTYDKIFLTNSFIVYNINPTVALRYQHLGINSVGFDEDTLIAIAAGQQGVRDKIILESNQEGRMIYIDINNGSLNDFIIDGGSWD